MRDNVWVPRRPRQPEYILLQRLSTLMRERLGAIQSESTTRGAPQVERKRYVEFVDGDAESVGWVVARCSLRVRSDLGTDLIITHGKSSFNATDAQQ